MANLASVFLFFLTDTSSLHPELFSDLASETSLLLASLVSIWKMKLNFKKKVK
jgi:hypothetical protein